MELSELQKSSWATSEEHGFHQAQLDLPPKSLATYLKLFLTIGELCEAGEELRAGRHTQEIYYTHTVMAGRPDERKVSNDKPWMLRSRTRVEPGSDDWKESYTFHDQPVNTNGLPKEHAELTMGKPEGFPIELADALIRLCDLAEDVGVPLAEATELKAAYNLTREHLHGKTA